MRSFFVVLFTSILVVLVAIICIPSPIPPLSVNNVFFVTDRHKSEGSFVSTHGKVLSYGKVHKTRKVEILPEHRVAQEMKKCVTVFVHGYSNTFISATEMAFQFDDVVNSGNNRRCDTILFSWPSYGSITGYLHDKDAIKLSAKNLGGFLQQLTQTSQEIHIVAHSMGNALLLDAIRNNFKWTDAKAPFKSVMMAHPDVWTKLVDEIYSEPLTKLSEKTIYYSSRNDLAIWLSGVMNFLGVTKPAKLPNFYPIDVSYAWEEASLSDRWLGHSFSKVKPLLLHMKNVIDGRGINHPVEFNGQTWVLKHCEEIQCLKKLTPGETVPPPPSPIQPPCILATNGSQPSQVSSPWGIALNNAEDRLYVCDMCNHVVKAFNTENGQYSFQFGREGRKGTFEAPGLTGCTGPYNVALNGKGDLIVSDVQTKTLRLYSPEGDLLKVERKLDLFPHRLSVHSKSNRLFVITGWPHYELEILDASTLAQVQKAPKLDVAASGLVIGGDFIYVTFGQEPRIAKYHIDDFVSGKEPIQVIQLEHDSFNGPWIDEYNDRLWIAYEQRINSPTPIISLTAFDLKSKNNDKVYELTYGDGNLQGRAIRGLAFHKNGDIFVSDYNRSRLWKFRFDDFAGSVKCMNSHH